MISAELQTGIDRCKATNLVDYIGGITTLKKSAAREWTGPCPKCGGVDRFHVNEKGWFCRQCTGEPGGGGHWKDLIDFVMWLHGDRLFAAIERITGKRVIDPVEITRIHQERDARERDYKARELAEMEEARYRLQTSGLDVEYHSNLAVYPKGRELWNKRGLQDQEIDYYNLGYCPSKQFRAGETTFTTATLTIPYYQYHSPGLRELIGLRHRLLMDNPPAGKYRPELAGLGNHLFYTDHEQPMQLNCLLVEGEIKALVTWQAIYQSGMVEAGYPMVNRLSVVGTPGHNLKADHVGQFDACERIWICLDPDANKQAGELARVLGTGRCKIIKLPGKIDDLLNDEIITAKDLVNIMEAQ